jgi:hypothetical protein
MMRWALTSLFFSFLRDLSINTFSYLTGFTESQGFPLLFLSFLKKLRKKNPAPRESQDRVVNLLWSPTLSISAVALEYSRATYGGIGFLSFRAGRTKGQQKPVNPAYPVSHIY